MRIGFTNVGPGAKNSKFYSKKINFLYKELHFAISKIAMNSFLDLHKGRAAKLKEKPSALKMTSTTPKQYIFSLHNIAQTAEVPYS